MLTNQQKVEASLEEAKLAYHQLSTGRLARVVVDQNGERVEFTATNRSALYNYIRQLESQLGSPTLPNNGPAGFVF